jgi:hypothetical protein
MTLVEKDARRPAILLAANSDDPANAGWVRHAVIIPASDARSQADEIDRTAETLLTARSSCGLRIETINGYPSRRIPEIQSQRMRRYKLRSVTFPLLLTFVLSAGQMSRGLADEGHTFIIAAADGYGVEDCLAEAGECGRVVADAWCEAHGHGSAIAFGPAEDVTETISVGVAANKSQRPYMVRCGD